VVFKPQFLENGIELFSHSGLQERPGRKGLQPQLRRQALARAVMRLLEDSPGSRSSLRARLKDGRFAVRRRRRRQSRLLNPSERVKTVAPQPDSLVLASDHSGIPTRDCTCRRPSRRRRLGSRPSPHRQPLRRPLLLGRSGTTQLRFASVVGLIVSQGLAPLARQELQFDCCEPLSQQPGVQQITSAKSSPQRQIAHRGH